MAVRSELILVPVGHPPEGCGGYRTCPGDLSCHALEV